jgi:Ca-activated chloride channel family protein
MALRAWTILIMTAALMHAQQLPPPLPAPPPPVVETADNDEVIRVGVDLVNVMATVRGKGNAIVRDLTKDDFKLFEDGKQQEIRQFATDSSLPLTVALMLDVSYTMNNYLETERVALARFVQRIMRPGDRGLVAAFRDETELFQDLTKDANLVLAGVNRLKARPRTQVVGTATYDAMRLILEKRLANVPGRKLILLLTDGEDSVSRNSVQAVVAAAQKYEVMIYEIVVPMREKVPSQLEAQQIEFATELLTTDTGGRAFKAYNDKDFDKVLDEIQDEVRSQYAISYASSNPKRDGKYRKIELKMAKREYRVTAREGYFAPKE